MSEAQNCYWMGHVFLWKNSHGKCLRPKTATKWSIVLFETIPMADAEIKVFCCGPRADKCSPFKAWSRSEYSHAYLAYCQECSPCSDFYFPCPFTFILQILSLICNCVIFIANAVPRLSPQNKIGHPAYSPKWFKPVPVWHSINRYQKMCYCALIDRWMVGF